MGITKLGLNLVKEAIEKTHGKSILSKSTEKKMCNFLLDFKKYGLSQGERKVIEHKSGKAAVIHFESLIKNLSEAEIKTVVKAAGKKAYQGKYLTAMREKITDTCSKEFLMKDIPAKPFKITKHDIPKEISEISTSPKIATATHLPNTGLAKLDLELKTLDTIEDLKKTSCKMFTEKKVGNDQERPFLMLLYKSRGNKELPAQIITESSIPGQYEIFDIMPNGKRFKTGLAEIGKKGEKHVERHLVSTDGKTTDLVYRDDNKGNTFLYSVIKDKSGKVMSETRRKFKKISKNHFMSSYNGQSYDIKWSNDKVVVTKLDNAGKKTKETVEYAIKDVDESIVQNIYNECLYEQNMAAFIEDTMTKAGIAPYTIDTKVVDMMKKLPGDEWFNMKKQTKYVTAGLPEDYNACFGGNAILMSKQHSGNFGLLAHELGHSKSAALGLDKDKKLFSIYNRERQRYQEMFPKNMQDSIEYFLFDNGGLRGLNETAAETNLINNTIQSWDGIQSRTIFLEKYFPETIAYIKNKFQNI